MDGATVLSVCLSVRLSVYLYAALFGARESNIEKPLSKKTDIGLGKPLIGRDDVMRAKMGFTCTARSLVPQFT